MHGMMMSTLLLLVLSCPDRVSEETEMHREIVLDGVWMLSKDFKLCYPRDSVPSLHLLVFDQL